MVQPSTSSGLIAVTAGASVVPAATVTSQANQGVVTAVECTAGSGAGTMTLYDGTSTAGIALVTLAAVPVGTTQWAPIPQGVVFSNGLFIVVSGTGSTAIVHYRIGG